MYIHSNMKLAKQVYLGLFVCMNCETYLALECSPKPPWPTAFEKSKFHQPNIEEFQFKGTKIEAFLLDFYHFSSQKVPKYTCLASFIFEWLYLIPVTNSNKVFVSKKALILVHNSEIDSFTCTHVHQMAKHTEAFQKCCNSHFWPILRCRNLNFCEIQTF